MLKKIKYLKIQTKMFLLIFAAGAFCMLLFRFLWLQKWDAWYFLSTDVSSEPPIFKKPQNDIWDKIYNEAVHYNVPESEDDKEAQKAIEPFLSQVDDYTAIYIYGLEDGLYRAGYYPRIMLQNDTDAVLFQTGLEWTDGLGEQRIERPVKFKNGYANVIVVFYHATSFFIPYTICSLIFCIALFLFTILFFVNRKMKTIIRLKQNILQMSSGDLQTQVKNAGNDELGILAQELNRLRQTLHDNFLREQQIHTSNQELITALSHDLRTPLTILKGYLEIVKLNPKNDMLPEYIARCINKTDDIKELTDRMFEYALVYDDTVAQTNNLLLTSLSCAFFLNCLQEHADFLRLTGFATELSVADLAEKTETILADETMIKRVFNNLFSNIIKYADKKEAVVITASLDTALIISMKNKIKTSLDQIESTQIGMKSVQKIMEKIHADIFLRTNEGYFTVTLKFHPTHLSPAKDTTPASQSQNLY